MKDINKQDIDVAIKIFNTLPQNFAWKDRDLRYTLMDDDVAKLCGFDPSKREYVGKNDTQLRCKAQEMAQFFIDRDKQVLATGETATGVCMGGYAQGDWRILMGQISPMYDDEKNIVGVHTMSLDVSDCATIKSTFAMLEHQERRLQQSLGQVEQAYYSLKNTYDDFGLTERQSEVLFYIIRGYNSKEIARLVKPNVKTGKRPGHRIIDKHREVVKAKMNCNTLSELVSKSLEHGLGTVVPRSVLQFPEIF